MQSAEARTGAVIARLRLLLVAGLVAGIAGATAYAEIKTSRQINPKRPFIQLKGLVQNQVIGPLTISDSFRAIESDKGVRIRNLRITGIDATRLQRDGIRIRGDADGVVIRNFRLAMRDQPQSHPNLPIGIAVQEGRNISIDSGSTSGFQMVFVPGKYTNGDGIATERAVDGISITRVRASDNSDGGFDLKSSRTRLDQLTAVRNGRNYRFWRTVEAGTLTSADARNAHIWLARGADVRIRKLVATSRSRSPVVRIEGPAKIVIDSCELRLPPGTRLVAGSMAGSQVSLGRGCRT
ncbi:MAG TPA: hypothetical protein VM913_08850 [Sphingomicrobium sp.]|jgi:hypothetical protein|nr:hypothetical protein [Sphingomicrobium sp.]